MLLCRIFSDGTPRRGAVLGLERRHGLAAVVAQGALLVELGAIAHADEAAVAREQRRLVGQRFGQRVDQRAMA